MNQLKEIYIQLRDEIFDALDAATLVEISNQELEEQLKDSVNILIDKKQLQVSSLKRVDLVKALLDELKGLGPLQALVDNDDISDIMINGPSDIFIEINGKVEQSPIQFVNEKQLNTIAKRIASNVGRRIDESKPLCDARLMDGSRVNIVIPPLAIDGTSISIRKFKEQKIKLENLAEFGAMSVEMAKLLSIASHCKCNILISGGTGSGKTTLLNALSGFIGEGERIVTIEDAAELQLQKPHIVRLETRQASVEGTGEITARDLVINALRMRPDRIIVGECRGGEAFEMLQAMNTGHDGSMSTLHANTPRDAIARTESMVMMATASLPISAIRRTIVSAVDLIVQVKRLHDGSRKVMYISEIIGMEGDSVVMEDIFRYEASSDFKDGKMVGEFRTPGLSTRSVIYERAKFFGLEQAVREIFS
ncbi:Type II/IV secretion system ATP hydrolase TadA/VirB11/CpaF, TadA subfamily [Vibrio chagasii]|jgi:pilus assembly protein CpaF|uniref:CpaF family protein n=1 Tax=Vibrio TaxID=662 RepID=UPI000769F348|nr:MULTISPECIES: CpaF family protein [Vibrio]CAH6903732.1 Type II/IV secretion system ATP hydrolase TadA/VirB11/CpaF, TadA subfamily [Vibrio chagasii]MDA0154383.1 CpaF family protein [Vibrio sp. Makdt]CAH6936698.1 Type II/IV secretion system ATP hydrolase TadA/VirB11/CpaF, TadA subfamily [Vibrio chagasii]CAH6956462.1 Type II/IV secretion system ATP hydrolase TadA/VirB11/CpaF, TadA subfamily [Vibrio chagasii]CAH6987457.1 Type II/IV secretion system ATP hydrolase TadA/VirB11/CpaF, TadA subfamily